MTVLGIDFDNTIVCYDEVFRQVAREGKYVPPGVPGNKAAVRDHLRAAGRENDWIELQGYVYGDGMRFAQPFPGALGFLARCVADGVDVRIISHRTRAPFRGPPADLHAAARRWLDAQGVFDPKRVGLAPERVIFELTKDEKIKRIAEARCTAFVDDLPELLTDPAFPPGVRRILFDPSGAPAPEGMEAVASWAEAARLLLDGARVGP